MLGRRTSTSSLLLLWSSAAFAQEYLPLHTGNTWVYRGPFDSVTVFVAGPEIVNGAAYTRVKNWFGRDRLLRYREPNVLVVWDAESKSEKPFIDFTTRERGEFPTAQDECSNRGVMTSRAAEISTPAGSTDKALHIRYPAANCADAGIDAEYWAPWIGLMRRTHVTIAGPRVYDLVYSRTGATVLSEPEVSFRVAIAGSAVRLTLRNGGETPLPLTFASGQTYEIVIRSAKNDVVYRWSDGRAFTEALRGEEFGHGDHVWMETVPLQNLGAGAYTVEAWLATMGGPRYSGRVGFEIR